MGSTLLRRLRRVEDCIALLSDMEQRLRYLQPAMSGLMQSLAGLDRYRELSFPGVCRARMLEGESFSKSWKAAVRTCAPQLGEEEAELVAALGDVLGATDLQSQLTALTGTRASLELRLDQRRLQSSQQVKLFRSLGVLGGAALAILLV